MQKLLQISLFVAGWLASSMVEGAGSPATFLTQGTVPYVVKGEEFRTYYKVHGFLADSTRPPLIVVHGGPGFTHDYLSPLADIAKPFEQAVVFYDQIGQGKSSRLHNKSADFFSVDLFANELKNLVDKLKIKEYHLYGHSWGSPLAAYFEITAKPPGLKSLILSNSLARFADATRSQLERVATLPDASEVLAGLQVRFGDPARFRAALESLYGQYALRFVNQPLPNDLQILDLWFGNNKTGLVGDTTVNVNMGPVLANFSVINQIPQIRVPTLLITGKWDMLQDYCTEPYFWGLTGRVKWKEFEASSHVPMWEERKDYIALVRDWLNSVSPKR